MRGSFYVKFVQAFEDNLIIVSFGIFKSPHWQESDRFNYSFLLNEMNIIGRAIAMFSLAITHLLKCSDCNPRVPNGSFQIKLNGLFDLLLHNRTRMQLMQEIRVFHFRISFSFLFCRLISRPLLECGMMGWQGKWRALTISCGNYGGRASSWTNDSHCLIWKGLLDDRVCPGSGLGTKVLGTLSAVAVVICRKPHEGATCTTCDIVFCRKSFRYQLRFQAYQLKRGRRIILHSV